MSEQRKKTTIDELELSVRTYNILARAGIRTIEELAEMSDEELCRIRNLGRRSFDEILKKFEELGIKR